MRWRMFANGMHKADIAMHSVNVRFREADIGLSFLAHDEALRIALNFAKLLPKLLRKPSLR